MGDPGRMDGSRGAQEPLHGSFVVADGNGGYRTQLTQTGTVTAVSSISITAESADGYRHTYAVDDDTAMETAITLGSTATIRGTETDGAATATAVAEGGSMPHPDPHEPAGP